eukprot:scaffold137361_cov148-Phaeocystis_antarctica.AAC.2
MRRLYSVNESGVTKLPQARPSWHDVPTRSTVSGVNVSAPTGFWTDEVKLQRCCSCETALSVSLRASARCALWSDDVTRPPERPKPYRWLSPDPTYTVPSAPIAGEEVTPPPVLCFHLRRFSSLPSALSA